MASIAKKPAPGKAAPSVQVGLLDILVSDRLRVLRPEVVDEIAESFGTIGQLQPIVVRQWKSSGAIANYFLVAGAHRVKAGRKLGWKTIAAVVIDGVDAELAEIDENLVRADLSPAERKAHIGRRKELYEIAHPETKHGGSRSRNEILKTPAFVDDVAKKTGRGRSTVARDAKHAETVAVLGEIPGTSLDSETEIEALSKRPVQEQRDLAEQAKAGIEVTAKPASSLTSSPVNDSPAKSPPAPSEPSAPDIAMLLQRLHAALRGPRTNTATAIAAAGARGVRETIRLLQDAIAEFDGLNSAKRMTDAAEAMAKSPEKPAADRAEAGQKSKSSWETIREMTDAAITRSKFPELPQFLDRRPKTQTTEELDAEAAAIAAEAAREKKWMQ